MKVGAILLGYFFEAGGFRVGAPDLLKGGELLWRGALVQITTPPLSTEEVWYIL